MDESINQTEILEMLVRGGTQRGVCCLSVSAYPHANKSIFVMAMKDFVVFQSI